MAGASVEARLHALRKLRARVKEQAEPNAADWLLSQSTQVSSWLLLLVAVVVLPFTVTCVLILCYSFSVIWLCIWAHLNTETTSSQYHINYAIANC